MYHLFISNHYIAQTLASHSTTDDMSDRLASRPVPPAHLPALHSAQAEHDLLQCIYTQ